MVAVLIVDVGAALDVLVLVLVVVAGEKKEEEEKECPDPKFGYLT